MLSSTWKTPCQCLVEEEGKCKMYTVYEVMGIWLTSVLVLWIASLLHKFFKGPVKQVKQDRGRDSGNGIFVALTVVSGIIALLVGCGIADSRGDDLPTKTVVSNVKELVAFHSENTVSGSIFLGCGYIDGMVMYNMYIRNSDGSMSPDRVDADPSIRIVEDKSLTNKGYWKTVEVRHDLSVPQAKWTLNADDVVSSHYEFDVPVGTVEHNFSAK
jgi:hypothetical protein